MESLLPRRVELRAEEALGAFPAVVIEGARQVGKSTLAAQLVDGTDQILTTLDDAESLAAALSDPRAFVDQSPNGTLVIDEVQRAPELILAIKASIDRARRPGRFLLTGSSNLLRMTRTPDSLAGRAVTLRLRPFSQGEVLGNHDDLLGRLRVDPDPGRFRTGATRSTYIEAIARGGYPDVQRLSTRLRGQWFDSYVTRLLERDVRDIAPRVDPSRIGAVLRVMAGNHSGEYVRARVARDADVPETTIAAYWDLLETMFLVEPLRPWTANLTSRASSKPKMFVTDPGLALRLARVSEPQLAPLTSPFLGAAMEGFVVGELWKQRSWSDEEFELFHFRDRNGLEVDIVVEFSDGSIMGIEVKSGSTAKAEHFRGLSVLRDRLNDRFLGGYVLNTGDRARVFGDRLWVLPVSALWEL